MNNTIMLTVTSLLTILLSSFHLADDVVRGFEPGGTSMIVQAASTAHDSSRDSPRPSSRLSSLCRRNIRPLWRWTSVWPPMRGVSFATRPARWWPVVPPSVCSPPVLAHHRPDRQHRRPG